MISTEIVTSEEAASTTEGGDSSDTSGDAPTV